MNVDFSQNPNVDLYACDTPYLRIFFQRRYANGLRGESRLYGLLAQQKTLGNPEFWCVLRRLAILDSIPPPPLCFLATTPVRNVAVTPLVHQEINKEIKSIS